MSDDTKVPPSQLKESDVLLYRGKSTIAKLIRFFDGTEVSHAGLFRADLTVAEALGGGLERRSVRQSAENNHWVLANRLAASSDMMSPVAAIADRYLARPNRYGYEQILLLALLAATRRLPVTSLLAPLLRRVFDAAATFIASLTRRGREPLICSEFVFRCYREAVAGDRDPYELRIAGVSGVAVRRRRVSARERAASKERAAGGARIDRGSLLDQLLRGGARDTAARGTTGSPVRRLAGPERRSVEALGEAYLRGAKARGKVAATAPLPLVMVEPELLRFGAAIARSQRRVRLVRLRRRAAATSVSRGQAVQALVKVAADFVTPGDLLKSPSLAVVGRLDLGARSPKA